MKKAIEIVVAVLAATIIPTVVSIATMAWMLSEKPMRWFFRRGKRMFKIMEEELEEKDD